jgi:NitT/TauT family transport system substrate-binding protein
MKSKLIFFLLFLTACGSVSDNDIRQRIRVAYLPITHSAAVMLMSEASDDEFNVELVRFTSWPEVAEALRSRRVDGAGILFEVALRAQETDGELAMLFLSHRDGNVIVADNSIETYSCLIGKTIAIPHRLSPQYTLLNKIMEREGLDLDQFNIVEISPAEMPFSMASGTISAYIVAEPYGSVAESTGAGRILEKSNEISPDAACCVLVFNREFLASKEGLHEWIVNAFEHAGETACQNREEAARIFRQKTSFSEAVIEESLKNTSFSRLELTEAEYNRITEDILRYGVLPSVPLYDDFVMPKP